jgi:hypothetical protein
MFDRILIIAQGIIKIHIIRVCDEHGNRDTIFLSHLKCYDT